MPKGHYLAEAVKDAIWVLRAEGVSEAEIARRLVMPKRTGSKYLQRMGGIRPRSCRRSERGLSLAEREEVSRETIYRALYVQARGSLRRELTRHLRTRRQKRFARAHSNRGQGPGCIAGMVMISERPPEVADRAVPGHWEGDLLMGTRDTAIATLVERQTRYCQLVALPEGTTAEPVCEALQVSITTL